jgi:hypothetical protein
VEKASNLWEFVSINRREENKDEGYQRVLSTSRVRAVADYILEGNFIPGSIILGIDKGTYKNGKLRLPSGKDVAWVIDGIMNVFEDVLKEATMHGEGFRVSDVAELFGPLKNFNFEQWREKGTGNKAETDAARDFLIDFGRATQRLRERDHGKKILLD